jgi:hypothetical protein
MRDLKQEQGSADVEREVSTKLGRMVGAATVASVLIVLLGLLLTRV